VEGSEVTVKVTVSRDDNQAHEVVVVVLGETRVGSHIERSRIVLPLGGSKDFYIHQFLSLSVEEVK
jgi:hypothetical protein